ncbi:MAG: hypothetical protein WCQ47_00495 [bacterium]
MKVLVNLIMSVVLVLFVSACGTFGVVSRSYDYSKQDIWSAMTTIINKNYNGVKKITPDPPTMISNLTVKDKKFGIDKTTYQVFGSVAGFSRPYVADIEVRSYANGEETTRHYDVDREKAQEIIDQIGILLEHRRYNSSIQDQYMPY